MRPAPTCTRATRGPMLVRTPRLDARTRTPGAIFSEKPMSSQSQPYPSPSAIEIVDVVAGDPHQPGVGGPIARPASAVVVVGGRQAGRVPRSAVRRWRRGNHWTYDVGDHQRDDGVRPHAARADGDLAQNEPVPARGDDLLGHVHLEAGVAQALGRGGLSHSGGPRHHRVRRGEHEADRGALTDGGTRRPELTQYGAGRAWRRDLACDERHEAGRRQLAFRLRAGQACHVRHGRLARLRLRCLLVGSRRRFGR